MSEDIFVGNSEMAALMRTHNWAQILDPVKTWSPSLRTTLNILLTARHPMLLFWGEELIQFYNDGYLPILGAKHPQALGQKGKDCWQDWHLTEPQIDAVMVRGESAWYENRLLPINRHGTLEEAYWTCSYSPVFEDGAVKGALVICTETTSQVIGERRSQTLQALTLRTAEAKTAESVYRLAIEAIAKNDADIPFALLYRLTNKQAQLAATAGIEPGTVASPKRVNLGGEADIWKLAQVRQTEAVVIDNLSTRIGTLPGGAWSESPSTAIALPIIKSGQEQDLGGVLVVGISPRQAFDERYQGFVEAVASQIASAIAKAEAYEADCQPIAAALRESEERFRQMAESIPSVFWLFDLQAQQHLYVSPAYEEIWGRSHESSADLSSWFDTIHSEDRERIRTALARCLANGTQDEEYRVVRPDGSIRWVRDRGFVVRDAEGQPYRLVGVAEDITDRKQAELAQQESERRFRRLVESNMFGVMFGNCFGQLYYANDCLLNLIGYSSEELYSAQVRWDQLTPPEFAPLDAQAVQQLMEKGVCTPYEKEYRHKDGRRIPILIGAARLDESDENQEIVAFVLDLTQLKQVTEERDRFFNLSLDMLAIGNLDGYFTQVNPAWEKTLGWTATELTTQPYLDFVHPDDRAATLAEAQKLARSQETVGFENRYRTKDGSYRWFSWSVSAFSNQNALYAVARDVTERKQAEIKLQQLAALVDNSVDFIGLATPDSQALYLNPAGCRLVGLESLEAALDTEVLDYFLPEDRAYVQEAIFPILIREGFWQGEVRFRHFQTGAAIPVEYSAFTVVDPQTDEIIGLASVTRDIRERVALEAERDRILQREQAAREAAERANRIKDEFLAVLSHELRSPLNPILGWAQLLRSRKFDEDATNRALETIERNAQIQTQLIDDLLDVSRILRGKLSLNIHSCDLKTIIEAAIETVRLAAQAKTIEIHTWLDPNAGQVQGDSGRLQQVLWNLLTNAVKFTAPGGRVEIRLERVFDKAQIRISDTGKGIDPEFMPYIFEGFRQEDYTITRKYGGLGLGLSIVRHLVELHGGTVHAASPGEDKGATFVVQLPANSNTILSQSGTSLDLSWQGQATQQDAGGTLSGVQILAVDDDADMRELLGFTLAQAGAKVTVVATAPEVLEALETSYPDLLISDLAMPGMDGYELIRQVRMSNPEIPAIALSAYARKLNQQQALDAGFQHHIAKPIQPDKLIAAISALLS